MAQRQNQTHTQQPPPAQPYQQPQRQQPRTPAQAQPQAYPQARQQAQPTMTPAQKQLLAQKTRKRYLKMAEQGIILVAIIVAILVVLFFLQGYVPADYAATLDIIRLLVFLILIGGLAYIGLTGVRELRTG